MASPRVVERDGSGGQEDIGSFASLFRTLIPDNDYLPSSNNSEQLPQQSNLSSHKPPAASSQPSSGSSRPLQEAYSDSFEDIRNLSRMMESDQSNRNMYKATEYQYNYNQFPSKYNFSDGQLKSTPWKKLAIDTDEPPSGSSQKYFDPRQAANLKYFDPRQTVHQKYFEHPLVSHQKYFDQLQATNQKYFDQLQATNQKYFEPPQSSSQKYFEQGQTSAQKFFEQPHVSDRKFFDPPPVSHQRFFEPPQGVHQKFLDSPNQKFLEQQLANQKYFDPPQGSSQKPFDASQISDPKYFDPPQMSSQKYLEHHPMPEQKSHGPGQSSGSDYLDPSQVPAGDKKSKGKRASRKKGAAAEKKPTKKRFSKKKGIPPEYPVSNLQLPVPPPAPPVINPTILSAAAAIGIPRSLNPGGMQQTGMDQAATSSSLQKAQSVYDPRSYLFPPGCIKQFACFICDEVLIELEEYTTHMNVHAEEPPGIFCDDCTELFENKTTYNAHRRLHTHELWKEDIKAEAEGELEGEIDMATGERINRKGNENNFYCIVCGRSTNKLWSFLKHAVTHRGTKPFKCSACEDAFLAPCALRRHIDTVHTNSMPFQCHRCLRRFRQKPSLAMHVKFCDVDIQSLPFAEELTFIDQLTQQRKVMPHIEEEEEGKSLYSCPVCAVMFDNPEELQEHIMYHDVTKPYKCDECDRGFRTKNELQKHCVIHLRGQEDCKCELCGVQLLTRSGYMAHLRGHRNQEVIQTQLAAESNSTDVTIPEPALELLTKYKEMGYDDDEYYDTEKKFKRVRRGMGKGRPKNYKCPLCDLVFHSGGEKFQAHARKNHKGADFLRCSECRKLYLGKENLERHKKIHNMFSEKYPCDECGKTFLRKFALDIHKKMHSFKKFEKCDICGQEFRFVSEVDRHKSMKHRFDKVFNIYKCSICGQRFPILSHLSVHCHSHTEPDCTPYECDLCKVCYKTSLELKQHIYQKHEDLLKKLGSSTYIPETGTFLTFNNSMEPPTVIAPDSMDFMDDEYVDNDDRDDLTYYPGRTRTRRSKKKRAKPMKAPSASTSTIGTRASTSREGAEPKEMQKIYTPRNPEEYNLATRELINSSKHLKRYNCEYCDKAFASNSDLKTHRRTHSGETPFKCEFCHRRFKQRGHRKLHIQVEHTMDKPFKCDQCDAAFPTRYRYQVHLKRHTGVKDHKCRYCGKEFYTFGKMNEHKKKRHTEEWIEEHLEKPEGLEGEEGQEQEQEQDGQEQDMEQGDLPSEGQDIEQGEGQTEGQDMEPGQLPMQGQQPEQEQEQQPEEYEQQQEGEEQQDEEQGFEQEQE